MAKLSSMSIPFPDFKLDTTIDPEEFDANNRIIQDKVNEIITENNRQNDVEASVGTRLTNAETRLTGHDSDLSTLDSRLDGHDVDISDRYTKTETDTLLNAKTTNTGDHGGTWQGLIPTDFETGQQAVQIQELEAKVDTHIANQETHIPSGIIVMWSGSLIAVPTGWSLCDGANGTPDLRGRFIVGAGGNYAVGATGGVDSVTLLEGNLPSHSHGVGTLATSSSGSHSHSFSGTTGSSGSHNHRLPAYYDPYSSNQGSRVDIISGWSGGYSEPGEYGNITAYTETTGSHAHSFSGSTSSTGAHTHTLSGSTASVGSNTAHENRPPYYALAYIMKL